METSKCFLFAFIGALITIPFLVQALDDPSGTFTSIDCGLPPKTSYIKPGTNLTYISDSPYITTGESKEIAPEFKKSYEKQTWNLRSFPQGVKNCYSISLTNATTYLILAEFFYGNYDGNASPPEFDVYIGANFWMTVSSTETSKGIVKEIIHVASAREFHLCLIKTGKGIPIISALEFRPLNSTMYDMATFGISLSLLHRWDFGSASNMTYRFGDDKYDRSWEPYNDPKWKVLSTTQELVHNNRYVPPPIVMTTAVTPSDPKAPLEVSWETANLTAFHVFLYFAEVQPLTPKQYRGVNINLNGELWFGPFVPRYLWTNTIFNPSPMFGSKKYTFSLSKVENSTASESLPPTMNALEVYTVTQTLQSETDQGDVDAIEKIKSTYGVTEDWNGDPCTPTGYIWNGLNCSYDASFPRITTLNLSSSGLSGVISASIGNLTMLQVLDLSNNKLTGTVPTFLTTLSHLKVLNLEKNMLTGDIPSDLIKRSKDGSLLLSVGDNPNLDTCALLSCKNNSTAPLPSVNTTENKNTTRPNSSTTGKMSKKAGLLIHLAWWIAAAQLHNL